MLFATGVHPRVAAPAVQYGRLGSRNLAAGNGAARSGHTRCGRRSGRRDDLRERRSGAVLGAVCRCGVCRGALRRGRRRHRMPAFARLVRLIPIAAAAIFAAFVVVKGVPTLRHDWAWPIDRTAVAPFLGESLNGWLSSGFGTPNPHPTTYLIGPPIAAAMWLFGPLAALALFAGAIGYACMRTVAAAAAHFGAGATAAIGIGLFALFNPWVYNEIVAGHLVMVLAYAGFIGLCAEMLRGRDASSVRLALWVALIEAQLQFYILAMLALVAFAFATRKWLPAILRRHLRAAVDRRARLRTRNAAADTVRRGMADEPIGLSASAARTRRVLSRLCGPSRALPRPSRFGSCSHSRSRVPSPDYARARSSRSRSPRRSHSWRRLACTDRSRRPTPGPSETSPKAASFASSTTWRGSSRDRSCCSRAPRARAFAAWSTSRWRRESRCPSPG